MLVLDPLIDARWHQGAEFVTSDAQAFSEHAMVKRRCALFIDESSENIGRYREEMFWLATRARHYGHASHFICQRPQQLNVTVRNQCEILAAFALHGNDAKMLAYEWNNAEIESAIPSLGRGEFVWIDRFHNIQRLNCFAEGNPFRLRSVK